MVQLLKPVPPPHMVLPIPGIHSFLLTQFALTVSVTIPPQKPLCALRPHVHTCYSIPLGLVSTADPFLFVTPPRSFFALQFAYGRDCIDVTLHLRSLLSSSYCIGWNMLPLRLISAQCIPFTQLSCVAIPAATLSPRGYSCLTFAASSRRQPPWFFSCVCLRAHFASSL